MKTNNFKLSPLLLIFILPFAACKKDKEETPAIAATTVITKTDINASAGIVYFNLTSGTEVAAADAETTKWDVAFDGKNDNIYLSANKSSGSAQIVTGAFDDIKQAPADGYLAAATAFTDFSKWANYTGATTAPLHAVLSKAGVTIIIKTPAGKYAKLQVTGFYKGNPDTSTPQFADFATRPAYGYYSIRYAIQADGSRNF